MVSGVEIITLLKGKIPDVGNFRFFIAERCKFYLALVNPSLNLVQMLLQCGYRLLKEA